MSPPSAVRTDTSAWLEAALRNIAATVHHEVRAPLALISTLAQLACTELTDVDSVGMDTADTDTASIESPHRQPTNGNASSVATLRLHAIARVAERALRTADELLATHRTAAAADERVITSFPALVEDLVGDLASVQDVALTLTIDPGSNGWYPVAPTGPLEVILQSLLANALVHSERATGVRVRVGQDASAITVTVENDVAAGGTHAGNGLGNPIVDLLCASVACRLSRDSSHGRYRVVLSVPAARVSSLG